MGKGVLLELDGRQAVVLTQQGEFKRVPLPKGSAEVGDEIEFADVKPAPWAKWGAAAAAAAVLLLAPFGWQAYSLAQPVAIVTMDINPSLQLTLNKADQVLKVEALNSDGSEVLQGVKWQRQPMDQVVAEVTAKAAEVRKLNVADASSAVVVAVVPVAEAELPIEHAHRIRDKAYAAISTEVTEQAVARQVTPATNLAVLEVSVAEKVEAQSAGITPGKLVISKKLKEKGIEVPAAVIQETGPGKLLQNAGVNPGTILGEVQQEHGGKPATAEDKGNDKDKNDDKGGNKDKSNNKGNSGNNGNNGNNGNGNGNGNGGNSKPVTTQPATPGNSDDQGGTKKNQENNGNSKKPDDTNGNSKKPDDNNGNGQENRGNSGKSKNDDPDDKSDDNNGKGNSGNNGKKEAWTLPFGIEIPKPAFLQTKDSDTTSPRAGAPEVGAVPSEQKDREQEKLQREQEKQQRDAEKEQAQREKEAKKEQEKRGKEGK